MRLNKARKRAPTVSNPPYLSLKSLTCNLNSILSENHLTLSGVYDMTKNIVWSPSSAHLISIIANPPSGPTSPLSGGRIVGWISLPTSVLSSKLSVPI